MTPDQGIKSSSPTTVTSHVAPVAPAAPAKRVRTVRQSSPLLSSPLLSSPLQVALTAAVLIEPEPVASILLQFSVKCTSAEPSLFDVLQLSKQGSVVEDEDLAAAANSARSAAEKHIMTLVPGQGVSFLSAITASDWLAKTPRPMCVEIFGDGQSIRVSGKYHVICHLKAQHTSAQLVFVGEESEAPIPRMCSTHTPAMGSVPDGIDLHSSMEFYSRKKLIVRATFPASLIP